MTLREYTGVKLDVILNVGTDLATLNRFPAKSVAAARRPLGARFADRRARFGYVALQRAEAAEPLERGFVSDRRLFSGKAARAACPVFP